MGIVFNADEIFEIAQQIERNGAGFYRRSAEKITESHTAQLLLDLAEMEEQHERIFSDMRKDLTEAERERKEFDPYDEMVLYLRAFADGHVFYVRKDASELLTGQETKEDIIKLAIGMEKDSIVFYLGIKEMVGENLGKSRIDQIIKEEMSHITKLTQELTRSKCCRPE